MKKIAEKISEDRRRSTAGMALKAAIRNTKEICLGQISFEF